MSRFPFPLPFGWFKVAEPDEVTPGALVTKRYFGTELVLMHGADPTVEGAILLSPPLHRAQEEHLAHWHAFGRPLTVLVPEFYDYLRPPDAIERFATIGQAEVIGVEGAKHLWVGERYVHRVLTEIVNRVRPGFGDLPTTWDGPYEELKSEREVRSNG